MKTSIRHNIKKIDRGQIKFREYSITLLQPKEKVCVTDNFFSSHTDS